MLLVVARRQLLLQLEALLLRLQAEEVDQGRWPIGDSVVVKGGLGERFV
jgi:hypothetical protein